MIVLFIEMYEFNEANKTFVSGEAYERECEERAEAAGVGATVRCTTAVDEI